MKFVTRFVGLSGLFFAISLLFFNKISSQTTLAQWTFEPLQGVASAPTANVGSGSSSIVVGSGTITGGTATGVTGLGCGAQTSGTIAWALNPFTPGNANEINGAQFNVSTSGQSNIALTWDLRLSNTATNTIRLKYTTDGSTWVDFAMTDANTTYCLGTLQNGRFEAASATGDQFRRVSVDFSAIAAVNNNPDFKVRLLAAHFQSSNQFRQTGNNTILATAGTWRFDNVMVVALPSPLPSVNLSASATVATEAAATVVTLTATASSAVTGNQYITLAIGGTGITASDYALPTAIITIQNGNLSGSATFTILDDTAIEGDETAIISLTNPTWGLGLGTAPTQNIMITDNDFTPNTAPTIAMDVANTSNFVDGAAATSPVSPFGICAAINDPTDALQFSGVVFTVGDAETPVSSLSVTATSANPSVVSNGNLQISGGNATRTLTFSPSAVGFSEITVAVSDGTVTTNYVLNYAASAESINATDTRFHSGASDGSTAIAIDDNYMLIGDDENQKLRLFNRQNSGLPEANFDFSSALNLTGGNLEVDIEGSVRVGNRIYWLGSHSNSSSGALRPNRYRLFATDISGIGAGSTLAYVGRFDNLRTHLLNWDANNLHGLGANFFGLVASAASGNAPESVAGFNIESMSVAPDGGSGFVCFRAPIVPVSNRTKALIVPWNNFSSLVSGNPTGGTATFGTPIQLNLGGRGIREIKRNSAGEYLIIAGPAGSATGGAPNDFRLYKWTGLAADAPILHSTDLTNMNTNGSFEGIVEVPNPLDESSPIQLIVDNGDAIFYNNGIIAKDLPENNHKKSRSEIVTLGAVALPIELLNFTATRLENAVVIEWVVGAVIHFSHFEVERSSDGTHFGMISRVGFDAFFYQNMDKNPPLGVNYYRLKSVDLDGSFSYGPVVAVRLEGGGEQFEIYPNPVRGTLQIAQSDKKTVPKITIFDGQGGVLITQILDELSVDVRALNNGIYFIKIENSEVPSVPTIFRFVKNNEE